MNYYALLLTFARKETSVYVPGTGDIRRLKDETRDGILNPECYFTIKRLFSCRTTIEHIYYHFPISSQPDYRILVATPKEPTWVAIYRHRNPPHRPGGPPAASEEDADHEDDFAGKEIYAMEKKLFRPIGDR